MKMGAKMRQWWRVQKPRIGARILPAFTRGLCATIRIRCEGFPEAHEKRIYCGWHGKSLMFAHRFRDLGFWVLISHSRDGDMQNEIFRSLGYQTIRGSTGRGGVRALVESIRALQAGGTMAMTPDGPRGPSGVVQAGAISMAQKSGAMLIPVGIAAKPALFARSWDRYMIPLPFSRGLMIAGEPIELPVNADEAGIEATRLKLEEAIHHLEREAAKRV